MTLEEVVRRAREDAESHRLILLAHEDNQRTIAFHRRTPSR